MGMRLLAVTGVLLSCISVASRLLGEGRSTSGPKCIPTLISCFSRTGCPYSHPVCDVHGGRCCVRTRTRREVEKVCPQTPPGINYMCAPLSSPDLCSNDQECPTGQKCCFVACGPYKCHDAVEPPASTELGPINWF